MQKSRYKIPIEIKGLQFLDINEVFTFENGQQLQEISIAYHTFGKLNSKKDNVIWVCHALTANSDVSEWWKGLFGENNILDPNKYFIVCVNILGSVYGTTGPRSINPQTQMPYGLDFPEFTLRDIVNINHKLAEYLDIEQIELAIGGSCGGHQVLEMNFIPGLKINKNIILVSSAKESAYSIAIHEAQRLALKADFTFSENNDDSGQSGLIAARGMGLIGYRTFEQYSQTQNDTDDRVRDFKAASYIQYQGKKLKDRFHSHSYYKLLNALDTHNIGRGRNGIERALSSIKGQSLIISINSDNLIPVSEQKILHKHIPNSTHKIIESDYGHDGFLTETEKIKNCIEQFLISI